MLMYSSPSFVDTRLHILQLNFYLREDSALSAMESLVQFKVQAIMNLNRTLLNLNRQSGSRFSQISEPNAKFDSRFTKFMLEPD
jgi:hypothetical protein